MLSLKLRRVLAGLGILSIGGLGLFAPTTAIADDNDTVPVADMGDDGIPRIPVKLHLPSGQYSYLHSELYVDEPFVQLEVQSDPCEEEACVPRGGGHPGNTIFSFNDKVFAWEQGDDTIEDVLTFPDANEAFPKPGVYSFTLHFRNWSNTMLYPLKDETYRMRVYVVQDGDDLKYSAVTIENSDGEKIDTLQEEWQLLAFEWGLVYKDVVNNAGLPEEGPYTFKLTLKEPAETYLHDTFTYAMTDSERADWIGYFQDGYHLCYPSADMDNIVEPDSEKIAGRAYSEYAALSEEEKVAAWNSNPTVECTYTLNDGEHAGWLWPLDGLYDIEEIVPNDAHFSSTSTRKGLVWNSDKENYDVTESESDNAISNAVMSTPHDVVTYFGGDWDAVRAEGLVNYMLVSSVVKFTNTYDDIPPTGILLEYMPYVLMTLIPLGAIGAYVAMRRKLLS